MNHQILASVLMSSKSVVGKFSKVQHFLYATAHTTHSRVFAMKSPELTSQEHFDRTYTQNVLAWHLPAWVDSELEHVSCGYSDSTISYTSSEFARL